MKFNIRVHRDVSTGQPVRPWSNLSFQIPEPFLSTLQNMGVEFLQGVENFQQDEVLFVQAFLHAAKMHFVQLS